MHGAQQKLTEKLKVVSLNYKKEVYKKLYFAGYNLGLQVKLFK